MAKIEDLKIEATALGLEYPAKIIKAELEKLIADKKAEAPENVESNEDGIEGAMNEATQPTIENEQNDEQIIDENETKAIELEIVDDEPKINNDGHIAGATLTEAELSAYMAKQKAK